MNARPAAFVVAIALLAPVHAPAAQSARALELWQAGKDEEALVACEQALAAQPDDAAMLELRARALDGLGRGGEAAQALRRIAVRSPAADLLLARCLARQSDAAAEADAIVARCASVRPETAELRLARARVHMARRRAPAALVEIRAVQSEEPERFEARLLDASCTEAAGRIEEARAQLAALVAQPEKFTRVDVHLRREARAALASLLVRMQRHADAIDLLRPLVAECPSVLPWRVQLASVLAIRYHYAESIENWEKAVELAPADAELRFRLGDLYRSQRLPDQAIAQYEKMVEIGKRLGAAELRLAEVHFERNGAGDLEKAREHVERALAQAPESGDVHETRGRIQEQLGLLAEARQSHRKAFERNPLRFDALYRLAMLLARSEVEAERAEAEALFERYARIVPMLDQLRFAKQEYDLNPAQPAALTRMAAILNLAGEYEQARGWAERAEKLDPRSVKNAVQHAYILANLDDVAGARRCFEKAIALARGAPDSAAVVATLQGYVEKIDRGEALPRPLGELSHPAEAPPEK